MADDPKPTAGSAATSKDKDAIEEALEIHELCVDNEADNRTLAKEDLRFIVLEEQWPQDIQKLRKNRPCLTINKLKAFRNQVVNDARQNTPAIRVRPVDDVADPMTAEVFNGTIRNIEQTSNADVAYDTAVQFAVDMGWGYFRIDVDYAHDDTFDQEILIKRVPNPFAVYGDPHSKAADSSDWNDAFIEEQIAKTVFRRRYKGAQEVDWNAYEGLNQPWKDGEEILLAEWWHRDEVMRPILLVEYQDGTQQVVEATDYEDNKELFDKLGAEVRANRETKSFKVTHRIMTGAEVLKTTEWLGKYIPIIPVYGEEANVEGERHFRSLIRSAKDAQRLYNYWRSTEAEVLQQAPRAPWVGPEEAFEGKYSANWETANVENHSYLAYKGAVSPQRNPGASIPAGFMQAALNMSDDIKAVLGMFNASLGMQGNETSGKAIRERREEGDTATFHFPDNLRRAIGHGGRILIDLVPKVYTGQRVLRLIGKDGKSQQNVPLGKPVAAQQMPGGALQVGDAAQIDKMQGAVLHTFDLARGRYDLVADAGPNFATKRQEASEQMMELLRVFPDAAPVIGDLLAQNLDWPHADEIAARLKALLPPAALGQEDPRLAQAMQMIQSLQQALQMAQQETAGLKMDKSVDMAKIAVDKAKVETENVKTQTAQYEAVTDRMAVLKPEPKPAPKANGATA